MAFDTLRSLKCFPEVDKRIKGGIPAEDVAQFVQEEEKEFLEIKRDSLIRQLYRYKRSVPANQLAIPEAKHIHARLEEFAGEVNEVDMLSRLFHIQMDRILGFRVLEKATKFPIKMMYKEMEQAKDILVKLFDMKVKLGLHGDEARTSRLHVTGAVARVGELSVDQRERLGSVADSLLKALLSGETRETEILQAEAVGASEEGGDWSVVEPETSYAESPVGEARA